METSYLQNYPCSWSRIKCGIGSEEFEAELADRTHCRFPKPSGEVYVVISLVEVDNMTKIPQDNPGWWLVLPGIFVWSLFRR